jgi:dTDP-4-amino-4,6-dideoxygalactose transaminase
MTSNKKIYLSPPHLTGQEIKFINEALETNWISPFGSNINSFEEQLEKYFGVKDVALVNSATAAIHLALLVSGIGPGDEVICPSLNFAGSVNPVFYVQAKPVFIDSDPSNYNIDPGLIEEAIISRKKAGKMPKAIIIVHLYGMPASVDSILEIANRYGLIVIDNAADALGSRYKNIPAGNFGNCGVVSFNGNKIITTSGGGAFLSKDESLVTKAKYFSNQAKSPSIGYEHTQIGYNYMLSNVLAGIGRGQFPYLSERIEKKRFIFNKYYQHLHRLEYLEMLEELPDCYSNRWLTTVVIRHKHGNNIRNKVLDDLAFMNIEARPLWKPMHRQPAYRNFPYYGNKVAEELSDNGICLPSGTQLTDAEQDFIIEKLNNSLKKHI